MWRARVGTGRRRLVFVGGRERFVFPIFNVSVYYNLFGLNIRGKLEKWDTLNFYLSQ